MQRRRFLGCLTGATFSALMPRLPLPSTTEASLRVSLAQWSLHRCLRGQQEPAIDNLDFAKTARGFGVDAIEYVNSFFKEKARDADYLAEMNRRAAGEGVRQLLIMIDGEGALGDPNDEARKKAVANHVRWLEAAKTLGCHSIRVNAQSSGERSEQERLAADGLRALAEKGATLDLNVIVENHGGLSSDGGWLAAVMRRVDHPRIGTLPDFGNFKTDADTWYDRYKGVEELMPFAKAVSAKSHDFDEAGNERHTDYRRMLRIVLASGYRGYIGIEYEGGNLSEHDGIRATKNLLDRVIGELSQSPKPR